MITDIVLLAEVFKNVWETSQKNMTCIRAITSKPEETILYVDGRNFSGFAQSQPLLYGGFKWAETMRMNF